MPANAVLLDRYKILKLLGAGGMGRVYLAEDQKLGMPVAIKVLRDILTQDPVSVKRLITEAKTSILLAHPNILRLHNFEDGETAKFLVMEFVDGESLADKIAREGKLSEDETRTIAIEVCKGLEHAHSKMVVHRDMKPGNVMLGKDGSVKIADFGLARLCHDSIARMTAQLSTGTLQYMSPEQLDGEIGESSDLYALGVTLYEMLSGDPPFVTGEITAQIRNKVPKPIEGISPGMNRIVLKCLEKKKENRFASVRELREELDGTAAQRKHQTETDQHLEALIAGGKKDFDEGKYSDAAALWEQALAFKPGDAELAESIKRARAQASSKPQVEGQAEHKGEIDQQAQIEALKARGSEAFNAGSFGDAIAIWQGALALNPGDAGLNDMISMARKQADLVIQEAERKKAEDARKQWIDDVVARANTLFLKRAYPEAENMLQQALQHFPGHTTLLEQLARVQEKRIPGPVPVKPEVKPKSRKKILVWTLAILGLLVVVGIIGNMSDSTDVTGTWAYTITTPNGNINGELVISGTSDQLQLTFQASYMWPGPDGMMHQINERYFSTGRLTGSNLTATCTSGTYSVDGIQYPPAFPMKLSLQLSDDWRSMEGQIQSAQAVASITAHKQ
ncbi:MAG: serine/threonine-protein kinase [Acidobacteriota bacterium]